MKYLNTYKESQIIHPIYITNVPINNQIFDVIKIHYNLTNKSADFFAY